MRVSSRKITRIVGSLAEKDEESIVVNATTFLMEVNEKVREMDLRDESVWNADQSGFEFEPLRNRTLSPKGEKIVEVRVVAKTAVSHSYTIQVHLSKAGKLGKNIFICFQEPKTGDHFGRLRSLIGC